MPIAPKRPCAAPGCGALTTEGRCPACRRKREQRRGNSAARGYNQQWRRFRAAFLQDYPLCGDRAPGTPETSHSACRRLGRIRRASDVDHVVPVTGPNDPRFLDDREVQSLCGPCHRRKTRQHDMPSRRRRGVRA